VGEPLEWVVRGDGSIALVTFPRAPAEKKPADMTLEELLAGIPEGAVMEEIDWGPPRGAEFW
jgi:antitoxin component of MazEF toxin-antitoxin module